VISVRSTTFSWPKDHAVDGVARAADILQGRFGRPDDRVVERGGRLRKGCRHPKIS
jgi:hypothetical protein